MNNVTAKPRAQALAESLLRDRAERIARKLTNRTGRIAAAERVEFDPFKVTRWRVVAGGDPGYLVKTPMRRGLSCGHCGAEFESKGWRYCPKCMELPAEERREPLPSPTGAVCQCPGCTRRIPKWRKGRRVSKAARFCSSKCANRARSYGGSPSPVLGAETAKKCPKNGGPETALFGPTDSPLNLIGGRHCFPGAPRLDPGLAKTIIETELAASWPAEAPAEDVVLLGASSWITETKTDSGIDTSIPDFLRRVSP